MRTTRSIGRPVVTAAISGLAALAVAAVGLAGIGPGGPGSVGVPPASAQAQTIGR